MLLCFVTVLEGSERLACCIVILYAVRPTSLEIDEIRDVCTLLPITKAGTACGTVEALYRCLHPR